MDNEFKIVTREYIGKVSDAFSLISELLGVCDKQELGALVRSRNDINFLLNNQKYIIMPHGRGCFFSNGDIEIDWEFGDGCICGIDPWMLGKFIKKYHPELYLELNDYESKTKIESEFEQACEIGTAIKKDGLYYLV